MPRKYTQSNIVPAKPAGYDAILTDVVRLLEQARHAAGRAVNAVITTTYWHIGRRIVEWEQQGSERAQYGSALMRRLAADLTSRFGRGFSQRNLEQMRLFYVSWPIAQTVSAHSRPAIPSANTQTPSGELATAPIVQTPSARFPLPWSHYVRLMSVKNDFARQFYEAEALRGGWTVRQLDRQIDSLFYERTALSRDKAAMLTKGVRTTPQDHMTAEEQIKDPFILEFLGLKDEYSESELEDALIHHLETFLLEMGGEFTFVGRQRRLRIGDQWYRLDLLFFHRRLRCLVIIDLKVGKLTHADSGQMHLYCNYAAEHWTNPGENPPVGLILCAQRDDAVAHYSLDNLPSKILAAEYRLTLPDERTLAAEVEKTRRMLESHPSRRSSDTGTKPPRRRRDRNANLR